MPVSALEDPEDTGSGIANGNEIPISEEEEDATACVVGNLRLDSDAAADAEADAEADEEADAEADVDPSSAGDARPIASM